ARAEPMPRGAAIDALIGAREWQRPRLDQIALLRILPVAELAPGAKAQDGWAAGIHVSGIDQTLLAHDWRRVLTLRDLGDRGEKRLHVTVDVRRQVLAGLQDQHRPASAAELPGDQGAGDARTDDDDVGIGISCSTHVGPPYPLMKSSSEGG